MSRPRPPCLDPLPSHLCSTSPLSCQLRPPCPLFPELPTQPSLSKLQAPKVSRRGGSALCRCPAACAPRGRPARFSPPGARGWGRAGLGQGVRWRSETPPGSPSRRAVRPGSTARFVLDPVGSPRPTKLPDCASALLGPRHFWPVLWLKRERSACGPPLALPSRPKGATSIAPGAEAFVPSGCQAGPVGPGAGAHSPQM